MESYCGVCVSTAWSWARIAEGTAHCLQQWLGLGSQQLPMGWGGNHGNWLVEDLGVSSNGGTTKCFPDKPSICNLFLVSFFLNQRAWLLFTSPACKEWLVTVISWDGPLPGEWNCGQQNATANGVLGDLPQLSRSLSRTPVIALYLDSAESFE